MNRILNSDSRVSFESFLADQSAQAVVRRCPPSPSTEKDEALVMVTKKNTFIHVDVIDEPVTSRRRTKSGDPFF